MSSRSTVCTVQLHTPSKYLYVELQTLQICATFLKPSTRGQITARFLSSLAPKANLQFKLEFIPSRDYALSSRAHKSFHWITWAVQEQCCKPEYVKGPPRNVFRDFLPKCFYPIKQLLDSKFVLEMRIFAEYLENSENYFKVRALYF